MYRAFYLDPLEGQVMPTVFRSVQDLEKFVPRKINWDAPAMDLGTCRLYRIEKDESLEVIFQGKKVKGVSLLCGWEFNRPSTVPMPQWEVAANVRFRVHATSKLQEILRLLRIDDDYRLQVGSSEAGIIYTPKLLYNEIAALDQEEQRAILKKIRLQQAMDDRWLEKSLGLFATAAARARNAANPADDGPKEEK